MNFSSPNTSIANKSFNDVLVTCGEQEETKNKKYLLSHLILNNFKSYRGEHIIGPFQRLSSIIGPNGAGKSNLLDAIAFVLNVPKKYIRSSSLSSLIYKPSCNSDEKASEASVILVLKVEDGLNVHYEKFMRSVSLDSNSECTSSVSINGKTVKMREYQEYLQHFNIIPRARNFVAFQGDIIAIARKSPIELSLMFEEISEANVLRNEIEERKEKIEEFMAELKTLSLERQRHEIQRENLKQQIIEADTYHHLKVNLDISRCALLCFKIYVNEVEYSRLKIQLALLFSSKESLEKELNTSLVQIREKDSQMLKLRGEENQLVQKLSRITEKHEKQEIQNGALEETFQFLKLSEQKLIESKKKQESLCNQWEASLKNLKEELRHTEAESNSLESDYLNVKKQYDLEFSPELHESYKIFHSKLLNITASMRLSSQVLSNKKKMLTLNLEQLQVKINDFEHQLKKKKRLLDESEISVKEISLTLQTNKQFLEEKCEELKKKELQLEEAYVLRRRLVEEKDTLESQISRSSISKSNYEFTQLLSLTENLQHIFNLDNRQCIMGMVFQLCHPTRRKYEVAVRVALGRFWKCIIVDSFETAKNAVGYLKSQKLATQEFANLDFYKSKVFSDHRLRKVVFEMKRLYNMVEMVPCIDILDYSPEYSSFFQCILRDTLIVDTLEDAKELMFSQVASGVRENHSFNIVTLQGEKLLKNGNFVVDTQMCVDKPFPEWRNQPLETYSNQYKSGLNVQLDTYERLEHIQKALNKHDVFELEQQLSDLSITSIPQLVLKIEDIQCRLKLRTSYYDDLKHEIASLEKHLEQLRKEETQLLSHDILQCNQELQKLEDSIRAVEEDTPCFETPQGKKPYVFFFNLEKNFREKQEHYLEMKKHFELQQIKLKYEIENLLKDLAEAQRNISSYEKELFATKSRCASLHQKKLDAGSSGEYSKEAQHELESVLNDTRIALQTLFQTIETDRASTRTLRRRIYENEREIQSITNRFDSCRDQTKSLIESAFVEHIPLPVQTETLDLLADQIKLKGWTGIALENLSNEYQALLENPSHEEGTLLSLFDTDENRLQAGLFYFSMVLKKGEHLELATSNNIEAVQLTERKLEEKVADLKAELETKRPNINAKHQYEVVQQLCNDSAERINKVKRQKVLLEKEYKSFRQEWAERFMGCFYHIQGAIQRYYKLLTGSVEDDTLSGTAYLELVEDSLSLSGGITNAQYSFTPPSICFNVVPPSKRFTSLKNLSGGEKAMTALSLLFAFHSYRPAPFLILDEVDADLDPQNLNFLANFIHTEPTQIIIISHSDRIFSRAEQLLGVYIDSAKESSAVISLNLSLYSQPTFH